MVDAFLADLATILCRSDLCGDADAVRIRVDRGSSKRRLQRGPKGRDSVYQEDLFSILEIQ